MKLKECWMEFTLAKNDKKYVAQKLQHLMAKCKEVDEKCAISITKANVHKLMVLDKEILGLTQLISHMERGGGPSLYPLPTLENPIKLKENIVVLNPCPFCELYYKCYNFICLACGHSYHPLCLLEHSWFSSKCLVEDCEVEFTNEWCATMGLRTKLVHFLGAPMAPFKNCQLKGGKHLKQQPSPTLHGKLMTMLSCLIFFCSC